MRTGPEPLHVPEDAPFDHAGDGPEPATGLEIPADPGLVGEALLALLEQDDPDFSQLHCESFLEPGGGWGGASAPVDRAQAIGTRAGLVVTSRKRTQLSRRSDHHVSQRGSDAVDMAGATQAMDRAAGQIAAAIGVAGWTGGILQRTCAGVRCQLIWRYPNHYDHVHFGCRRV